MTARTANAARSVVRGLAVLAFVHAALTSFVSVVPWCAYTHLRYLVACWVVAGSLCAVSGAWRKRMSVRSAVWGVLFLLAVTAAFGCGGALSRYAYVRSDALDGVDMEKTCASARKALKAVGADGWRIVWLINYPTQKGFGAERDGAFKHGSSNGDGYWTICERVRREGERSRPGHDAEDVLREVRTHHPDSLVELTHLRWSGEIQEWLGESFSRKYEWSLRDDLTGFTRWSR